jgi:hypothetical protein
MKITCWLEDVKTEESRLPIRVNTLLAISGVMPETKAKFAGFSR